MNEMSRKELVSDTDCVARTLIRQSLLLIPVPSSPDAVNDQKKALCRCMSIIYKHARHDADARVTAMQNGIISRQSNPNPFVNAEPWYKE